MRASVAGEFSEARKEFPGEERRMATLASMHRRCSQSLSVKRGRKLCRHSGRHERHVAQEDESTADVDGQGGDPGSQTGGKTLRVIIRENEGEAFCFSSPLGKGARGLGDLRIRPGHHQHAARGRGERGRQSAIDQASVPPGRGELGAAESATGASGQHEGLQRTAPCRHPAIPTMFAFV